MKWLLIYAVSTTGPNSGVATHVISFNSAADCKVAAHELENIGWMNVHGVCVQKAPPIKKGRAKLKPEAESWEAE